MVQGSDQKVSTLICGEKEELSFLSFLIRAHLHGRCDTLREKAFYPRIHQDLREKWEPEVLFDTGLRERILAAAFPEVTGGPSTFLMIPLVEMHLDRTRVITQKTENKVRRFVPYDPLITSKLTMK